MKGCKVQVYTPENTREWETIVEWEIKAQLARLSLQGGEEIKLPFERRVLLDLRFNMPRPDYMKKAEHHLKKPDFDNLAKSVVDAMTSARIMRDDTLVTDSTIRKRYFDAEHPVGVEIQVTGWLGEAER